MTLLKELRERRLFHIAIPYGAGGWALLQVVDQLADRGVLPEVVYRVALIWFLIGIPAALLIGWNHGEKGKQRAPLSEIVIIALLLGGALGLTGRAISRQLTAHKQQRSEENPLEMRNIAVRYFEDQSPGGGYDYLADGLTETLIAELQQVRGLEVVSRNGTMPFRDTDIDADSIARQLQVGTLVAGSIAVKNDKVHVNLEVIDGQSGTTFQRHGFDERLANLGSLRQTLVNETARILHQWIGEEVKVRQRPEGTTSNDAWLQLQRAEKARKDAEQKLARRDTAEALAELRALDGQLARAESADPKWVEPIVARAALDNRLACLSTVDTAQALAFSRAASGHAERALALDRTIARALEARGTARYHQWQLRATADSAAQANLRAAAQSDLENAVRFDGTLASAYATLAQLYSTDNLADAVVAATRAYEEDAYLPNADLVLWRLFSGSLDLGNFTNARQWCAEGARRFPGDYRFLSCQLQLLATPGTEPDVDEAWLLLARLDSVIPPARLTLERARGELSVGGVLARAGQQDSARAVLDRASARITPRLDPSQEILLAEAHARLLNHERERALDLLTRYAASRPHPFASTRGEIQWYWRDLQDDPRARKLFDLN